MATSDGVSAVFLGQKPIGERCFARLRACAGRIRLVGAVSNIGSDAPYNWWKSDAIHRACMRDGIPFVSNERRNEEALAELIGAHGANAIISVQHPWILSAAILKLVGFRAFNLHNAKLPDYRGYNSISHAILNGDQTYTSTIHWMAETVDTGDIAFEETVAIESDDTARSLYDRACAAGERGFERLIDHLQRGADIPRVPIAGEGRFFGRRSLDALREVVDPGDPREVDRKTRAFHFPPFEPAYCTVDGARRYLIPGNTR